MTAQEGGPGPSAEDLAALARFADELADGIVAALPRWVIGSVDRVVRSATGEPPTASTMDAAGRAGEDAAAIVGPRVRALLALDIDEQRTGPLELVREAVPHPTRVLLELGIPPVERDASAESMFPDDPYDLTPTRFADLSPELHEPGLVWGAAKAHVHLARRRAEGRR